MFHQNIDFRPIESIIYCPHFHGIFRFIFKIWYLGRPQCLFDVQLSRRPNTNQHISIYGQLNSYLNSSFYCHWTFSFCFVLFCSIFSHYLAGVDRILNLDKKKWSQSVEQLKDWHITYLHLLPRNQFCRLDIFQSKKTGKQRIKMKYVSYYHYYFINSSLISRLDSSQKRTFSLA